jgi:hypothetical protein
MYKPKRYLGNTNTLEVHDTADEKSGCELSRIKEEHKRWYDSLSEAKRDHPYDNCAWCIGNSLR